MKWEILHSKVAAMIALGLAGVAACGVSNAAVIDLPFAQVVTPPSVAMAGPAPWLDVMIADTATVGTVAVTVTASLIGAQTLTGIWLNIPSVAGALTSFTLDPAANGSGEDPLAFAAINAAAPTNTQSAVDTTQDIHPTGATKAQVGDYNLYLRFANNAGSAFQGTETETFNLVANPGSGLNANSFLFTSAQTAGGKPNPPYFALASFTNADGSSGNPGSGIAYIASAVAEPDGHVLMLAGLGLLGLVVLRRTPS